MKKISKRGPLLETLGPEVEAIIQKFESSRFREPGVIVGPMSSNQRKQLSKWIVGAFVKYLSVVIPFLLLVGCSSTHPTPTGTMPPLPSNQKATSKAGAAGPKVLPKKMLSGGPSVTLAWDPSPSVEVSGYNVYQGGASRTYTNVVDVGPALTVTFTNFARGTTLFYAATAYATNGLESDFSAEVSYTSPLPPEPPINLRVTAEIAFDINGPWVPYTNWMAQVLYTNTFFRLAISEVK